MVVVVVEPVIPISVPTCDLCGEDIPPQYRGEDDLACHGLEFCSMLCLGRHVEHPDWRFNADSRNPVVFGPDQA